MQIKQIVLLLFFILAVVIVAHYFSVVACAKFLNQGNPICFWAQTGA